MKKEFNFSNILINYKDLISAIISIASAFSVLRFGIQRLKNGEDYIILIIIIPLIILLLWFFRIFLTKILLSKKIKKFYLNINRGNNIKEQDKNFLKSWSLLSYPYRKLKWNDEISRFKNGYKFTRNIDLIKLIYYNTNKKGHSFIVIYKDDIESPEIKNLQKIQNTKIGEFSNIQEHINQMTNEFVNAGLPIEKFNSLDAKLLFKNNFSDIVRWEFNQELIPWTENNIPRISFLNIKLITIIKEGGFLKHKYKITDVIDIENLNF